MALLIGASEISSTFEYRFHSRMVKIFDLFDALRLANSAGLVAVGHWVQEKDVFNIRLACVTS
jgi:hypothetical protein